MLFRSRLKLSGVSEVLDPLVQFKVYVVVVPHLAPKVIPCQF